MELAILWSSESKCQNPRKLWCLDWWQHLVIGPNSIFLLKWPYSSRSQNCLKPSNDGKIKLLFLKVTVSESYRYFRDEVTTVWPGYDGTSNEKFPLIHWNSAQLMFHHIRFILYWEMKNFSEFTLGINWSMLTLSSMSLVIGPASLSEIKNGKAILGNIPLYKMYLVSR